MHGNGEPNKIYELTVEQATRVKEMGILEIRIGTHRALKFFDTLQAIRTKMQRLCMPKQQVAVNVPVETCALRRNRLGLDNMSTQEAYERFMREVEALVRGAEGKVKVLLVGGPAEGEMRRKSELERLCLCRWCSVP